MKPRFSTQFAALVGSALLAGCAGSGDKYPSLAIRDAERAQGQFSPVAPDPEPVRPVVSPADLDVLIARASESHAEFVRAEGGARTLVEQALGQSIESNVRQRALVALADLATMRSETALPMADLDLLRAEAATTFAPTAEIDEARQTVQALLADEDGTLDALWTRLAP